MPADLISAKCMPCLYQGKPVRRRERIVDTKFQYRRAVPGRVPGVAEYYRLVQPPKARRLKCVMERSLTKRPARKCRISVQGVCHRCRVVLDTGTDPAGACGWRWIGTGNRRWPHNGQASPGMGHHAMALNGDPVRIWSHRSEIALSIDRWNHMA